MAEIELVRRMRESGWQAGWVDTFGSAPKKWVEWIIEPSSLPSPLCESYQTITQAAGHNGGGKPDIVAWRGESLADAVFLEYKGPNDRVRVGQDAWFRAALRGHVPRSACRREMAQVIEFALLKPMIARTIGVARSNHIHKTNTTFLPLIMTNPSQDCFLAVAVLIDDL